MEENKYFPSLQALASQAVGLSFSVFSDDIRETIYSNDAIWLQVWSSLKHYNRLNDFTFAQMLNIPFAPNAPSSAGSVASQGKNGPSPSKRQAPAASPKKVAPKKPTNVFALLADDEDDDSSSNSEESSNEKSTETIQSLQKLNLNTSASVVVPLAVPFAVRHLDCSDLAFISESLICKAIEVHGSHLTILKLARCYQITLNTAKSIASVNPPLEELVLSGCRLVDDAFVDLILPCLSNVTTLNLGLTRKEEYEVFRHHAEWDVMRSDDIWSPPKRTKISPEAMSKLTRACPNLTELNLSGHETKESEMINILSAPSIAANLVSLDISFCSQLSYGLKNWDMAKFAPLIPQVRHLKCEYLGVKNADDIEDEGNEERFRHTLGLVPILKASPELETLHMCGCEWEYRLDSYSYLTNLRNLSASDIFDYKSIRHLAPTLTALLPINFGMPRDDGENIVKFYQAATNLVQLNISRSGSDLLEPLVVAKLCPKLEKLEMSGGDLFENVEPFRHFYLRKLAIQELPKGPIVERLADFFPYLQKLELFCYDNSMGGRAELRDVLALSKLPFFKSLLINKSGFVFKTLKELKALGKLRHLEELRMTLTPAMIPPFLSWRHKFSTKLRYLLLNIKVENMFFPKSLDIATKDIPEWCSTRAKQPVATWDDDEGVSPKKSSYVDPYAGKPLFPSLNQLAISKIACLSNRMWSLLARDICPNIHELALIGDMDWSREWNHESGPVDNVKEEGKTEEVVLHALELFKQVRTVELANCWKHVYIKPENTPDCPQGYIARKRRFLKNLYERGIAVFIRFDIWGTYRGYKGFSVDKALDNDADVSEIYL